MLASDLAGRWLEARLNAEGIRPRCEGTLHVLGFRV